MSKFTQRVWVVDKPIKNLDRIDCGCASSATVQCPADEKVACPV
jgi:hypothetical protein